MGYPKSDPHGDLIPDAKGNFAKTGSKPLSEYGKGDIVTFVGVAEHSNSFLQYLTKNNLTLGNEIKIEAIEDFDNSLHVKINNKLQMQFSKEVVKNLLVVKL